jgi:hypothetical protein
MILNRVIPPKYYPINLRVKIKAFGVKLGLPVTRF